MVGSKGGGVCTTYLPNIIGLCYIENSLILKLIYGGEDFFEKQLGKLANFGNSSLFIWRTFLFYLFSGAWG